MTQRDPVRLAVVGSTKFVDPTGLSKARRLIEDAIDRYRPELVISGGADGVDKLAASMARQRGIEVHEHLPKNRRWKPEGFEERNLLIANECTHLVRVSCAQSKTYGSGWTADRAEAMGKPVERHVVG